ncbi:hypothetical protein [Streptacidiphilus sp. PAMC 29251]
MSSSDEATTMSGTVGLLVGRISARQSLPPWSLGTVNGLPRWAASWASFSCGSFGWGSLVVTGWRTRAL